MSDQCPHGLPLCRTCMEEAATQVAEWVVNADDRCREEIHRLRAEVERLTQERDALIPDPGSEHAELLQARATIDHLTAEVERLQEIHRRGCECSTEDACRFARERDEARAHIESLQNRYAQCTAEVDRLTRERDVAREVVDVWRDKDIGPIWWEK